MAYVLITWNTTSGEFKSQKNECKMFQILEQIKKKAPHTASICINWLLETLEINDWLLGTLVISD